MNERKYRPSGELQGDTKAMPDRGTGTGFGPNTDLGGMSTGAEDTNSLGGISGSTGSDPAGQCKASKKPRA